MYLQKKILVTLIFLSSVISIYSQLSSDPSINLVVCKAGQTQRETKTRRDIRTDLSNFDIYAQNIDARGKPGTNRYLFKKSELNETNTFAVTTSDSLTVMLPLQKTKSGFYSITVFIDSMVHPAINELIIKLSHLTKTDKLIYNLTSDENLIGTVLDDYALNTIRKASSPYTGMFKPHKELSPFITSDLNGEWILSIEDNNAANDGVLKSWGLVFNKEEITNLEETGLNKLPNEFALNQNYPNPFNPGTKISWQSSVGSWQTIKVFDVLGNEVATLINEFKPAGSYEIEFNGNNLASGIYFCRMQAGSYVSIKKMMLLK